MNFHEGMYFTGETDWKVLCIDVTDPLAKDLNGKFLYYFDAIGLHNFESHHNQMV